VKILVLGGAGFLGVNIVEALTHAGLQPTAAHRKRTNTILLRRRKVPRVLADLDDLDSLTEAMRGFSTVVHAAGHYPTYSNDLDAALVTGVGQSTRVLDAAAAAGVKRLIYLSSTATVAPSERGISDERDLYEEPPAHGVYHFLKWQMEQVFLGEDRLEVVVLCAGACIGPWDLRVGTSALLVATARGMQPPHPDGWVNLVDARDVGRAVSIVARRPAPSKRLILAAHSRRVQPLLEDLSQRYGVAAPSLPLDDHSAIALADRAERRAVEQGGRADLVREIVDLIVNGVPIRSERACRELHLSWTPLHETLDAFDAFARRMRFIPEPPAPQPAAAAP